MLSMNQINYGNMIWTKDKIISEKNLLLIVSFLQWCHLQTIQKPQLFSWYSEIFYVLRNFSFTKSEMMRDYYL